MTDSSHNYRLRIDPSLTSMGKPEDSSTPAHSIHGHDDDTIQGSESAHDIRDNGFLQPYSTRQFERRGTVDRNAQFHSVSSEEREHLRCVEYQAVRLLSYVVPMYLIAWQLFGCIALGIYVAYRQPGPAINYDVRPWFVIISV